MSTNVASVISHFPDAENGFTTTTAGSVGSGATTVTLASVGGYTNGMPVVLVIDPTDAAKKQTFTGIVDTAGVQITSVVWTAGTNQTHALGATVVDYATATHIAMVSKGILVEHKQTGKHSDITADSLVIADGGNIEADHILEASTGHGVVIDGFSIKDNMPKNWDGWINPDETWTYASASTFTVTGDQTAKYTKGTRLKFTQTTVKYAVVVSSAYTSSTTVTIAVNTDYTIANAAITANCYSYMANPQGYPVYFNYTVTTTAGGTSTPPTYATVQGRFQVTNGYVSANIVLNNSSGGTPGSGTDAIYVNSPVTPQADAMVIGNGVVYESGGTMGNVLCRRGATTAFYLHSSTFANIVANDQSSATRYMGFDLHYPMA